ncbi:MAG: beta-glucosidase [Lachnospiraceae bacterium]|nr:beta-glucosidase [Lachnospiraceae bacterium]
MGFPKDFLWGSASAAFQIEGAYNEDGKGLGIWDALSEGHIRLGATGNVACDHYHRYKEDVAIMKELGLKSYRFSISWPRVIPKEGVINEKGLAFYKDLVKELTEAGIEPMVTLFHWNLPMWMHEKGGWLNPQVADYFAEYAKVVVTALSDKVKYWMTINEPQLFAGAGYVDGGHAPFLKMPAMFGKITRNIMLAHGKAVKVIRENALLTPMVGMAPTGSAVIPKSDSAEDLEQARFETYEGDGPNGNAWWADPICLGILPEGLKKEISAEDLKIIHQPLDFYGFNIYTAQNFWTQDPKQNPALYDGMPRTGFDWAIKPESIYYAAKFHYERYGLPIIITENGMSNPDFVMLDGKVHDPQRIDYIHRYLLQLKRAVDEGVKVIGYQYWSILDNMEWTEGYERRFGLVHVDYQTLKRTIKDSGYFYAEVIKTNGENL